MERTTMDINSITLDNYMELYQFHINKDSQKAKIGRTPLCQACIDQDQVSVESLIKSGVDVNVAGKDGKMPLHLVCESGPESQSSIDIATLLISNGANIDAVDCENNSPIFLACEKNNIELVKLFLNARCKINKSDYSLNTPMKVACRNANSWFCCHTIEISSAKSAMEAGENAMSFPPPLQIAKLLLEADASQSEEATCLPTAVQFTPHNKVKDLLESGMSPDILDENGRTALGCACMIESVEPKVVELLLKFGADVNKGGSWEKQKPLKFAFVHNSLEKIKILLSYGASITSEEMTELVSVNLSKSILENPEVIEINSEELLSWKLLLAAGFNPTLLGKMNSSDDLTIKLHRIQKFSSYKQVLPWLKSLVFPMRTLKEWCRISIRKHLRISIDQNIKTLIIPVSLKEFLLFNEFERNKITH